MKNRIIYSLLLCNVIIYFITICNIHINLKKDSSYENYPKMYIDLQKIEMMYDENFTGYILFSRDTCPNCIIIENIINNICYENKNILIYKFNTDEWRSDDRFNDVLNTYNVKSVPHLIYIKEGNLYEVFNFDFNNSRTVKDIKKEILNFLLID